MESSDAPLDEHEFAELAEYLDGGEDAMSIYAAQGFLTGVITAPTAIPPTTWQAAVLGTPRFRDRDHAQRIFSLLFRCYNDVLTGLAARRTIRPADFEEEDVSLWCAGYLEAVDMDPAWGEDEQAEAWLVPVALLAGEMQPDGDPAAPLQKAERRLAKSVLEAYDYWTAKRTGASSKPAAKVGRNDPCPCGSGNKYKKCCALKVN